MIKNKVELPQTNNESLFGKELCDHLTESVKPKNKSIEVFLKLDDSTKPYKSGTSFQQQQLKRKRQKQTTLGNRGSQGKQNWSWNRKDTSFQGDGRRFQGENITNLTSSQHIPEIPNAKCKASKRWSINEAFAFKRDVNKSSRYSSSWKDKSLLSKLGKVYLKPVDSVSDYTIPLIKTYLFQQKNPNFTRMKKKQTALVDLELK